MQFADSTSVFLIAETSAGAARRSNCTHRIILRPPSFELPSIFTSQSPLPRMGLPNFEQPYTPTSTRPFPSVPPQPDSGSAPLATRLPTATTRVLHCQLSLRN